MDYCGNCSVTHDISDKRICAFNKADGLPEKNTPSASKMAKSSVRDDQCELEMSFSTFSLTNRWKEGLRDR